jgi:hypothetical protein
MNEFSKIVGSCLNFMAYDGNYGPNEGAHSFRTSIWTILARICGYLAWYHSTCLSERGRFHRNSRSGAR